MSSMKQDHKTALRTVLVTGGAGFIGSHVTEALLAKGYKVRVLDNFSSGNRAWVAAGAELVEGDVADAALCRRAVTGVDGICHMAAMSRVTTALEHINLCTQSNVVGTQNILLAAREAGVKRFVYSGSSTYYGNGPVPQREGALPPELLNFYAVTKAAGEEYALLFDRLMNVPSIVLRYFNVYGPRQPEAGMYALVLGIFLKRLREGKPLEIHGGGAQRRDFVHVLDVVRANIMALESDARGVVLNVGSGTNHSIKELADMISPNQVAGPARAGDAKATLADISRIQEVLGWQPTISLEDGLKGMMAMQAA